MLKLQTQCQFLVVSLCIRWNNKEKLLPKTKLVTVYGELWKCYYHLISIDKFITAMFACALSMPFEWVSNEEV